MSTPRRRVALVPIKGFERAKSRLSVSLPPQARARVARDLALRSLDALEGLRAHGGIEEIVVLTASPEVSAEARRRGCRVLADPVPSGGGRPSLSQVVDHALHHLTEAGVTESLVVMADLAEVHTDALVELLDHPPPVAAPDHHGTGTNALLTGLPVPGPTSFGRPDSLARHLDTWGEALQVVPIAALARDVDEPEDL